MPDVPFDGELRGPDPSSTPGAPLDPMAHGPVDEAATAVGAGMAVGAGADRKRTAGSRATVVHGGRRRPRPPRRRRWTRRALVATGVVVVLIVVLGLGGFFY
ncbi:MAG: hypothetical protein ACLQCU_05465, partial [Acidimicrobiales bacterium]